MDIWSPAVASADTQQFCKRTTLEAYELQRVETTREALLQLVTQLESFPTHYAKILARPTVPEPKGVWSGISDVAWDTAASVLRRFTGRLTEETLQQKDVNKVSPVESLKMAENIRKMFSYANGMPLEAPVVYERSDVQASPRFVRRQRRNSRSIPTSPALPDAANHSASPEHIATPTPIADDHQHDTKAGDATPMPGAAAALAPSLSSASPGLFLATTKVAENDSAPHSKARGGHSSANPPRASSLASQLKQTRAKLRQVSPGAQQRPHSKGHTLLARLVEHSLLERFRFARGDDSCTTSPTPSAVARSVSSSLWPSPVSGRRAAR